MNYDNPFPGMNPYLEDPLIWPGFHNQLIARMAFELGPQVPANYRVDIQERTEVVTIGDAASEPTFRIPDARVTDTSGISQFELAPAYASAAATVVSPPENGVAVKVARQEETRVTYLYVQRMPDWKVVTVVEVLSPTNKIPGEGRINYLHKREEIFASGVSLVEIDLLRGGPPMPLQTVVSPSHYRILVSRGWDRPDAVLYPFNVQQAIPKFTLPLSPDDDEPEVNLGSIVNTLHHTARYAQVVRYADHPPGPALAEDFREWMDGQLTAFRQSA